MYFRDRNGVIESVKSTLGARDRLVKCFSTAGFRLGYLSASGWGRQRSGNWRGQHVSLLELLYFVKDEIVCRHR